MLTLLLALAVSSRAQNRQCDSLYYGDTLKISKYQKNDTDLVLLYRRDHITIKAPLAQILKEARTLKMTEQEIRKRAKYFKLLNLENDIAEFNFCDQARRLAVDFLYKNSCCIIIDGVVVKKYKEVAFKSTNCLDYTRFIFDHEIYYALENIRILD